ncbi:MAG: BamA/TamA family outer membrane protein [Prevotella sp.]|nr:BamA/TamA family outer membrane protein [Prevotella sp.]
MKASNILYILLAALLMSCSMTKGIPEDDQLFTGLTKITYTEEPQQQDEVLSAHLSATKAEIEAALATQPNGALFGSSYYTVPWSWHLWVYNKYSGKESGFAKWMVKSFGKPPVLMSKVNPALRASVAQSVLQNNGFFRGYVTYETIPQKNPKKCKIGYTVAFDSLYVLDSISYANFPTPMQALIDSSASERLIKSGAPFSIANLDGERARISNLMRNNGYYFYNTGYASYLADTFAIDGKAQLRLQLASGLPDETTRKWYIGNIDVNFRKSMREQLNDSIRRRHLTIHYNGKKSPIRPGVVLKDLRLRPRQEYSYERYLESASLINSNGVFSSTDFQFTPRPDTDTLDLRLNCVFDKPYDFYIEGNMIGRTSGRYGPQAKIGFTKRNAFRAGEKLDINLHGAYEFARSGGADASNYQYGADASLEFPRLLIPFYNPQNVRRNRNGRPVRRRSYYAASTLAKVSADIVRRPDYYKMHIVGGEWTYRWQRTETSRHEFSPLTVKYQFMSNKTIKFDSIVQKNRYLERTMGDYFIPKMRYTYTYTSPTTYLNPIRWETTIEEASNFISLIDMACGRSFNEKEKELFKNPYAQFVRLETDFTKTWSLGTQSCLVGHINAGIMFNYGNSNEAPFSEEFYVGGANSIRAFAIREIGPGSFSPSSSGGIFKDDRQTAYLMRNGDLKFVANLEYRTPLFGNLKGAVFLDMGNVWRLRKLDFGDISEYQQSFGEDGTYIYNKLDEQNELMKFHFSNIFDEFALGTGVGLRYDLGFLVVRLDWGIALHTPYDTGKSGYFNIQRFKDANTLHFAIGYPF